MRSAISVDAWDMLTALEGFFIDIATMLDMAEEKISWSWMDAESHVRAAIQRGQQHENILLHFAVVAKNNSDHVRATTANKTWNASWLRRVSDMMASFRKQMDAGTAWTALSKLFILEFDSPMPASQGVCFQDVYLDAKWQVAQKLPSNNCYLQVNYNFFYEKTARADARVNVEDFRVSLRKFLQSLYYKNEHGFHVKLCFLHAAFHKACTGKMLFLIGKGGDGKGMEAILDSALFGLDASATLDCGVFFDRVEFRILITN